MQQFKAHIAIFLIAAFLFPQGASGMHYFLVEHHSYDTGVFDFNQLNDFEYHSCTYHLNGFSPLILNADNLNKTLTSYPPTAMLKFYCLENYVHQPNFNFQLRGPPFKLNFSVLKN